MKMSGKTLKCDNIKVKRKKNFMLLSKKLV